MAALGLPAAQACAAPLYVPGPEGPWDEVADRLDDEGRAVVCTTWGQWLTAVLLDPELRSLLGDDWPRFRQTPAAAGRMRFAVSRYVVKYAAATALDVPAHTLDLAAAGVEVGLAHTGELIVVGVSRTGAIGVAAEPADRDIDVELLRGHVCTAEEGAVLDALPEAERRARLLGLWTLKEAYTQALGQVGRRRFATFGFGLDAGEWSFATHLVQDRYLVGEAHRARS